MKERKQITIQIAGQTFRLSDPKESSEAIRQIETDFNKVWGKWCDDFRTKSPQEVLAMVAFQYARFYYNLRASLDQSRQAIEDFEKQLDQILLNVE